MMSNIAINLDSVILAFLRAMPNPTDEHIHKFSELLGLDFENLEERIFQLFSNVVEDLEEPLEDATEEDFENFEWDDLDIFLVSFFLQFETPTEDQFHKLSELIGVNPKEMEERVYALLAQLAEETETDDDEDQDDDQTLLQDLEFPSSSDRIYLDKTSFSEDSESEDETEIDLERVLSRLTYCD